MVRMSYPMNLLAAATLPIADKLRAIPPEFWFKALIAVVGLIAVVIFLRKVTQMNKAIAAVIVIALAFFLKSKVTSTGVPTGVSLKKISAIMRGRRMQPCEAG